MGLISSSSSSSSLSSSDRSESSTCEAAQEGQCQDAPRRAEQRARTVTLLDDNKVQPLVPCCFTNRFSSNRRMWELPMRCNPLTVTGPVPALSRMVTGAFSSNSPRLTWEIEGKALELHLQHARRVNLHLERNPVPWAGSSGEGWRWAQKWSSLGGSWTLPPPHWSPPWHPLPDKPVNSQRNNSANFFNDWQPDQSNSQVD